MQDLRKPPPGYHTDAGRGNDQWHAWAVSWATSTSGLYAMSWQCTYMVDSVLELLLG